MRVDVGTAVLNPYATGYHVVRTNRTRACAHGSLGTRLRAASSPDTPGSGAGDYVLLLTLRALISRRPRRIQPHRLHERAVARRIPHGEPHPRFARRVEWNREALGAERAQVGG